MSCLFLGGGGRTDRAALRVAGALIEAAEAGSDAGSAGDDQGAPGEQEGAYRDEDPSERLDGGSGQGRKNRGGNEPRGGDDACEAKSLGPGKLPRKEEQRTVTSKRSTSGKVAATRKHTRRYDPTRAKPRSGSPKPAEGIGELQAFVSLWKMGA